MEILSNEKITAKVEAERNPGDFFKSLSNANVTPLPESVFVKNDDIQDKYIYKSVIPTPRKKMTSTSNIFEPVLSPIKEVDETDEIYETPKLYEHNGGSRDSKIENDKILFIVILFLHGGYAIDNTKTPVTSVTRRNAPLIVPRNKFDGYESLTICGAAPASQINTGIPSLIDDVYHPVVMENLNRFSLLLTEKISSVEITSQAPSPSPSPLPSPSPSPKSHSSSSRFSRIHRDRRAKSVSKFKKGGGGKKHVKSKHTTDTPVITLVSSIPKSTIRSKFPKFPKIVSSIQKVSHGIKRRLFSLVTGCVKIVMSNFKVDYAFLDVSDERYNIIQKNAVNAIICMSQRGALKINDDLFDAFSYALLWGLRRHDQQYFYENCRYAISQAVPGSDSCIKRQYALANAYERFPCIRTIVKGGLYNANHVEKTYSYHPVNDAGETSFFDIGLDEIFAGKSPDPMLGGQSGITLSEISLLISSKIDEVYFEGKHEKKRVSIIDISCSSFFHAQPSVPLIPKDIGIGGGRKKRSRRNKTRRRNERKGRNKRSNSKIRNRPMSRRTRRK